MSLTCNSGRTAISTPKIGEQIGKGFERSANTMNASIKAAGTLVVGAGAAALVHTSAPVLTEYAKTCKKGIGWVLQHTGINAGYGKIKEFLKARKFVKEANNSIQGFSQKVKNLGLKKLPVGQHGPKNLNLLGKFTMGLNSKLSAMSGKNKLYAGIALATLATVGYIFNKASYNAGRIDQKYDDRARFS